MGISDLSEGVQLPQAWLLAKFKRKNLAKVRKSLKLAGEKTSS